MRKRQVGKTNWRDYWQNRLQQKMHYFIHGGVEPKGKFGRLFLDITASSIQEVKNLGEPIAKPAVVAGFLS